MQSSQHPDRTSSESSRTKTRVCVQNVHAKGGGGHLRFGLKGIFYRSKRRELQRAAITGGPPRFRLHVRSKPQCATPLAEHRWQQHRLQLPPQQPVHHDQPTNLSGHNCSPECTGAARQAWRAGKGYQGGGGQQDHMVSHHVNQEFHRKDFTWVNMQGNHHLAPKVKLLMSRQPPCTPDDDICIANLKHY